MKFALVVFSAVLACALAAPVEQKDAETIVNTSNINPDGSFDFSLQTSNGIVAHDSGKLRESRDEKNNVLLFVAREGSYSYVDNEGHNHEVKYVADENGYRAEGADIPRVV